MPAALSNDTYHTHATSSFGVRITRTPRHRSVCVPRRAVSMPKRVRNREEEQGGERERETEELSCCLQTAGGESE